MKKNVLARKLGEKVELLTFILTFFSISAPQLLGQGDVIYFVRLLRRFCIAENFC